ncbi:MAG: CapA family protein [Zoogloeaceae bacterium]|jgi:poly-gamma-glutamate capsule biosynthesis protein CapA/YwtB (metallophosphatase superfamily)|nr:CapA family protein [Zoogloeaceae bacterium]
MRRHLSKRIALLLCLFASSTWAADTLTFAAVGDIMMGLNYPNATPILPPQDGALTFESVGDTLRSADITIGNLEGVLLDSGGTAKSCANPNVCYVFRMPERYAKHLVDAGFDLMSIANNHSGDFGEQGRKSTVKVLSAAGIGFAGFEGAAETHVMEKDGVKYGFVAFAPNIGTVSFRDLARAKALLAELRKNSDIVIVSMHIGAEGPGHTRVTRKTETFVGENRGNPYEFARFAIDNGADLVFGHGPHVARAVDLYKGKFIAYSLGNFATNTSVNISGKNGYAPIIKVRTDKNGNFIDGEIISAIQEGENGARRPVLDATGACIKEIKKLTEADIPESGLNIDEKTGKITRK